MTSRYKRNEGPTMITSNPKQPYKFTVTIDTSNSKLKIQAKHIKSKDRYLSEFTQQSIKKIGYHQSLKGFYNRLRMAFESKVPQDLLAYYYIQKLSNTFLPFILQNIQRFHARGFIKHTMFSY